MGIKEIRKNIIATSSNELIEEISDYLMNGNFIGKEINNIIELFATSHNNQEKRNEEDFKYFYDKVAFVDFCEYNNLPKNKLSARKYLAAAYNPQTHEFSYSSNKFYKEGNTPLNTILVLNVKGSEIYKVLTALYTCLRDNGIDNCITIPSFNRFEEGLTDSVRININAADMERVVGLIGDLPLPIINLMDKPSMLYPRVNDYIGYDAVISKVAEPEARMSRFVCKEIEDVLCSTILYFLDHDGKELIENGGDTIINFRKSYLDENKSIKECDLRILQRMVAVDPSNKQIFIDSLKEVLLKVTNTKSAYIDRVDNEEFDDIYGKLDDESILFESENLEFDVATPIVEEEGKQTLTPVPLEVKTNDLMVQEEQSKDLMVQEEQSKDLLVQEEEKELTPEEQPKKGVNEEARLQKLLDDVQNQSSTETTVGPVVVESPAEETVAETTPGPVVVEGPAEETVPETTPLEIPVVEEAPAEENTLKPVADTTPVVEDDSKKEDVHFYEESANVGENFVVSSTPAEATPVENNSQVKEESEFVRVEDMTDEQKKLVSDTYAISDTRLLDGMNAILNKFSDESDLNGLTSESSEQSLQEDVLNEENVLNKEEVQSLVSNELDQGMIYERALKYKDLVNNISILNTKVKGTDFTLLDYFDQQQLLSRIDPNASYMTFTDEVYDGKGIVEECIIKYVSNYGNVPLDKISEEYGIRLLGPTVKKDKPKGLMGLFKKKRS